MGSDNAPGNAAAAQADDSEVAISIRDVSKAYGDTTVVVDLNLEIPNGQIVALVGPSGCGKTTTLRMINRLIEPTSGSIEVFGEDQGVLAPHDLRRRIGYVIQNVGLFPHLTIGRNIAVVPELLKWDRNRIRERINELVDLVGLDRELLDRYPSALSGGQQQRVGVARALAADPPILLMDEPFSAVDPVVRERLQDDLLALQQRVGKTIVIVTHDVDEAIKLGDRVAIMQTGGVMAQYDTPTAVLRSPANAFVANFLGRERGLRRLSLLTVADVDLSDGPIVDVRSSVADAIVRAKQFNSPWIALREGNELVGWVTADPLAARPGDEPIGNATLGEARQRFVSWVTTDTSLREALDQIVTSRSRMAIVLDPADQRTYLGFVNVEDVAGGLEQ